MAIAAEKAAAPFFEVRSHVIRTATDVQQKVQKHLGRLVSVFGQDVGEGAAAEKNEGGEQWALKLENNANPPKSKKKEPNRQKRQEHERQERTAKIQQSQRERRDFFGGIRNLRAIAVAFGGAALKVLEEAELLTDEVGSQRSFNVSDLQQKASLLLSAANCLSVALGSGADSSQGGNNRVDAGYRLQKSHSCRKAGAKGDPN